MKAWLCTVACLIFYPVVVFSGNYPIPLSIKYGIDWVYYDEFEVEWGMTDVPGLDVPPPSDYDTILLAARAQGTEGGMLIGGGMATGSAHASGNIWATSPILPGETMEAAAKRFFAGLPTYFNTMNSYPHYIADGCIGVVFTKSSNRLWSNVYSPPNTCVVIPAPTEPTISCDILTPSITLDHGEIGVGKTVSSIASADLNIDCKKAVSANIQFESSALKLGAMVATLSVPNTVNGNIPLHQGGNMLSVKSTLNGTALTLGTFTASTVMKITFN